MKQALADALEARGYTTLTPVQEAVSSADLTGADMLVSAQTGSGKTIGFGLAIAPGLLGEAEVFDRAGAPMALVIAPTRELALQVRRELGWLYAHAGAVIASTVGGMDMRDERRALDRGAHIVVATPGRLRDHIMRGSMDMSALRAVVLDEADEMLDLGFREDLEFILSEAPADRQTLMFSATVPAAIAKLAKSYQKDAQRIATTTGASEHADIAYHAMTVSARDGENAIINVLRFHEAPNAIVFCNTRAMVNRLTTRLSNRGFSVVALSGELSQTERTHALQAMRDGRARVCVATDVAARGIDLPNLDLVIHAELPSNHETLLHRSGRTGRAGRKGVSALIVPPAARKKAERLLTWAKLKAEWGDAPSADAVSERDEERMLADPDWQEPVAVSDQATVAKLVDRFSAEQLAAAYLRLYHGHHSAPEELQESTEVAKPRAPFGPSIWFSLPGGQAAGAEPRRLLPMLCRAGGLTREDIGAIRVHPDTSYLEIRAEAVPGLLETIGASMTIEDGAVLTQLDGPPAADRQAPAPRPAVSRPPRTTPRPAAATAPARHVPKDDKPAPTPPAAPAATPPVDWNDAPAPRAKKPKPVAKPPHAKGGKRPDKPRTDKPRADKPRADSGTAAPWKPRKTGAAKPKPAEAAEGRSRGTATPVGKPSSKKNRARQKAAEKPGGTPSPGSQPPTRRKP